MCSGPHQKPVSTSVKPAAAPTHAPSENADATTYDLVLIFYAFKMAKNFHPRQHLCLDCPPWHRKYHRVPPQSIDFFEKQWMAKWGLATLLNKDLPSFQSSKWSFLSARKVWKTKIAERHGSFVATACDVIQRKKPHHPSQYPAYFLLTLLSST